MRAPIRILQTAFSSAAGGTGPDRTPHVCFLTCDTLEQAINRAGVKAGNKGFEASVSAIEMVKLLRQLPGEA